MPEQEKPDYGLDAPGVIRNLLVIGVGLIIVGYFLHTLTIGPVTFIMRPSTWPAGFGCLIGGLLMILYAKRGKFGHRARMLAQHTWRGDEQVLDVGTGRGLLMIGAAKKLTTGRAYGIDIWNAQDLSGNRMENTLRNAELEGVRDTVDIRNEDATAMKFADGTFDVVLSNLCIHNIPSKAGRDQACREIARVLKPGGVAVISDFKSTRDYVKTFAAAGLDVKRTVPWAWDVFPPLAIVRALKQP